MNTHVSVSIHIQYCIMTSFFTARLEIYSLERVMAEWSRRRTWDYINSSSEIQRSRRLASLNHFDQIPDLPTRSVTLLIISLHRRFMSNQLI